MSNSLDRRHVLGLMGATALTVPLAASAAPAAATGGTYLTKPWTGPYGGVPPFDKVKIADFEPATKIAMDAYRAEINAITMKRSAPTFESISEAYERAGESYNRVGAVYGVWDSNLSTAEFQEVSARLSPVQAAFGDEINQNKDLFQRIETVYTNRAQFKLNPQQDRLLWKQYNGFVRRGAKLSDADKKTVADLNQQLATLFDTFAKNLKHDEAQATFITKDDLAGLPDSFVASAKTKATDMGQDVCTPSRTRVRPWSRS